MAHLVPWTSRSSSEPWDPVPDFATEHEWVSYLCLGTVLDEDAPASERVRAAGGPGTVLAVHGAYEINAPVDPLPSRPFIKGDQLS